MIFFIVDIFRHQNRVPNPTELIDNNIEQLECSLISTNVNELIENNQEDQSVDGDNEQIETVDQQMNVKRGISYR